MFQEQRRIGVYRLFAEEYQFSSNLFDLRILDGISKISAAKDNCAEDFYSLMMNSFGKVCYRTLYVDEKSWFSNAAEASNRPSPQLRWEFYANYATVLTQVILACHHECIGLIDVYRPRVRIQELLRDFDTRDRQMIFHAASFDWNQAVSWISAEDAKAFEIVKRADVHPFFLKLLLSKASTSIQTFDSTIERVSEYIEKWDELILVTHCIPVDGADMLSSIETILEGMDVALGILDDQNRKKLVEKVSRYKKVCHALVYKMPNYTPNPLIPVSNVAVTDVFTFSLIDLVRFKDPVSVDTHDCETDSSLLSKWADDFLPTVVQGSNDIKFWFQSGVNMLLADIERSLTSKAFSGVDEIIEVLKKMMVCSNRVSAFVRTVCKCLRFVFSVSDEVSKIISDKLLFVSIDERHLMNEKQKMWENYWKDVQNRQKTNPKSSERGDPPLKTAAEAGNARFDEKEKVDEVGQTLFLQKLLIPSRRDDKKGLAVTASAVSNMSTDLKKQSAAASSDGTVTNQPNEGNRSADVELKVESQPRNVSMQQSNSASVVSGSHGPRELKAAEGDDLREKKTSQNDVKAQAVSDAASEKQKGDDDAKEKIVEEYAKFFDAFESIAGFLVTLPSVFNSIIHQFASSSMPTLPEECVQLVTIVFSDLVDFAKFTFQRTDLFNQTFCRLKAKIGLLSHLKDYRQEIDAAATKIKNAALDELKALGDKILSDVKTAVGSSAMETFQEIGVDSIFGTFASMYSDFASTRRSHSQPQRVREVAAFCMQILARVTSDANIQKELMKRQCLESDNRVMTVLKQPYVDGDLHESILSNVLHFWCIKNCPRHRPCTYCSSSSKLDSERDRSMYFECDLDIQKYLQDCMADLEKERLRAESVSDPRSKQQIILKCRMQSKVLSKLAGNIVDIGTKLSVVMDFIGDIQDQLSSIDNKLVSLQVSIDSIRQDVSRLVGLPVVEIIQEHSALELKRINQAISKQVYVPPKVAGRMFAIDEIPEDKSDQDSVKVLFLRQQKFINSIMFGCNVLTKKHDENLLGETFAESRISDIQDFHRFLELLAVIPHRFTQESRDSEQNA
jgi:hypothetical protein